MLYISIILLSLSIMCFIFKREIVWYFEQKNKKKFAAKRRAILAARSTKPVFIRTGSFTLTSGSGKDHKEEAVLCSIYKHNGKAYIKYRNLIQNIDIDALEKENKIVLIGNTYENSTY